MTDIANCYLSNALDGKGNIYIAYWENADKNGNPKIGGIYDVVITKITTVGQTKWTYREETNNTSGYGWQPSITADSKGNSYVAFPIKGDPFFSYGYYIKLLKINTNGILIWDTPIPYDALFDYIYPSISINSSGEIVGACCVKSMISTTQKIMVFKVNPDGDGLWIQQNNSFNTNGVNTTPSITYDNLGNICVTYCAINGNISGQPSTGISDIIVFKLDGSGNTIWVKQNSSFNTQDNNESPYIAVDLFNNYYICYNTNGVVSGQTYSGGASDIVVFKLDQNGNTVWVTQQASFNTTMSDAYPTIAVDRGGNVYVSYCTSGVSFEQTQTGWTYDIVIFKISTDGITQWVQQQPVFNTTGENINPSISVDKLGSIYIAYPTDGSVNGVPVNGPYNIVVFKMLTSVESHPSITSDNNGNIIYAYHTDTLKANQQNNIVIIKKDPQGNTIWRKQNSTFNTQLDNRNPRIISVGDECYVVYQTSGELVTGESLFPYDIVVIKINSKGNVVWAKQNKFFNTTRSDELPSIDVDNSGNLYVAYQTTGRIRGGYRTSLKDQYDIAIFKMDPKGNTLWTRQSKFFNSYRGNETPYICVDKLNEFIYVAFSCLGRIPGQQFAGYRDIVLIKFDLNGVLIPVGAGFWVIQQPAFNTELFDLTPVICVDNLGYIYLCYVTNGGSASGQSNVGMSDIVICKLKPNGTVVNITQSPIFNTTTDDLNPSMYYHKGYLYITYQTSGKTSGQINSGQSDIVIMKINSVTLGVTWIKQNSKFNTSGNETNPSITIDKDGNFIVAYETTGSFSGLTFGNSYRGIIVTKGTYNGSIEWVKK